MDIDYLFEILKLIITGTIGGLIASRINWRLFRKEAKFEDDLKHRDTLVIILGELVTEIDSGAHPNLEWWGLYKENSKEALERVNTLKRQIESYIPTFIGDKEAVSALYRIINFIGADLIYWRKRDIPPFKEYDESLEVLRIRLKAFNKELYE